MRIVDWLLGRRPQVAGTQEVNEGKVERPGWAAAHDDGDPDEEELQGEEDDPTVYPLW